MLVRMPTLYGKFTVETLDNAPFAEHATVEFSAAEPGKVRMHAKVANTMNGVLKDEDNTLKGLVMSTMMYGGEAKMALENALSGGFDSGMAYKVSNGKVTLTSGSHTIVLAPQ